MPIKNFNFIFKEKYIDKQTNINKLFVIFNTLILVLREANFNFN